MQEYQFWQELIDSSNWKYLHELYGKHRVYLQKKVNEYLRKGDCELARIELAKMDDLQKQLDLIKARVDELKKKKEG